MYSKLFISFFALLFFFSCHQNKRQLTIGVINLKTVMESSAWGKSKQSEINAEIAKREKIWNKSCAGPLKDVVMKLQKLQNTKNVNQEELKHLDEQKQQLARKCTKMKLKFQQEIEELNTGLANQIIKKVKEISEMIAKQYHIDLILTKFRGVVLFNSKKIDITNLIIKNLNE